MSNKPKPTKQELLNELESIRASLSESGEPLSLEDIPVLMDTFQHSQPGEEASNNEKPKGGEISDEASLRAAYKATLDDARDYVKTQAADSAETAPNQVDAATSLDSEDYEFELKLEGIVEEQINQENAANEKASKQAAPPEPEPTTANLATETEPRGTETKRPAKEAQTRIQTQEQNLNTHPTDPEDELNIESLVEAHLLDDTPIKPLPGQQSLFDEATQADVAAATDKATESAQTEKKDDNETAEIKASEKSAKVFDESEVYVRPKATGENPFLPAHIRERLSSSRNQLMEDLAQVDHTLKKPPSSHGKPVPPSAFNRPASTEQTKPEDSEAVAIQQEIIDQLVAKFMPEIEAELRAHLEKRLAPQDES